VSLLPPRPGRGGTLPRAARVGGWLVFLVNGWGKPTALPTDSLPRARSLVGAA